MRPNSFPNSFWTKFKLKRMLEKHLLIPYNARNDAKKWNYTPCNLNYGAKVKIPQYGILLVRKTA